MLNTERIPNAVLDNTQIHRAHRDDIALHNFVPFPDTIRRPMRTFHILPLRIAEIRTTRREVHVERLTRLDFLLETIVYRLLSDVMERSMFNVTRSFNLCSRQNTTHLLREPTTPRKHFRKQEGILR